MVATAVGQKEGSKEDLNQAIPDPTVRYQPFRNVIVEAYGAVHGDWRITDWHQAASFARVVRWAKKYHLRGILVPSVRNCTGKLCRFKDLNIVPGINGMEVRAGCSADGVTSIPRGWGFFTASADCKTVVAFGEKTGTLIAAHAARDSLLNREFASGVDNISLEGEVKSVVLEVLDRLDDPSEDIHVRSYLGIGAASYPHRFDDPEHGRANRQIWDYLKRRYGGNGGFVGESLDIDELIRLQCLKRGVLTQNIRSDGVDTCADLDEQDEYRWHSFKRTRNTERNGIFVAHIG